MQTQINVRIDSVLKARVAKRAKQEGVSVNTVIVQCLQEYAEGELELRVVRKNSVPIRAS